MPLKTDFHPPNCSWLLNGARWLTLNLTKRTDDSVGFRRGMRPAGSITAGWMQMQKYKIAVLDDYQNVAVESADWSVLRDRAEIAVFQAHLAAPDAVIERLLPFDVVCAMRERTPLPRNVIERLPNLKLIASTGPVSASIDVAAAGDHGIAVVHTGYRSDPTIEFTWALILAAARHIVTESNSVRSGGW